MLIPDLGNFELWGKSRAKCLFWKVLGEEARLSNHVFLGLRGIVGNARLGTVFFMVRLWSLVVCMFLNSKLQNSHWNSCDKGERSRFYSCRFMVVVDFLHHSNSSVCAWVQVAGIPASGGTVLVLLLGSLPPLVLDVIQLWRFFGVQDHILAWTILRVCIDWSIYKLPSCYLT
jgi:hypothetical protein